MKDKKIVLEDTEVLWIHRGLTRAAHIAEDRAKNDPDILDRPIYKRVKKALPRFTEGIKELDNKGILEIYLSSKERSFLKDLVLRNRTHIELVVIPEYKLRNSKKDKSRDYTKNIEGSEIMAEFLMKLYDKLDI